MRKPDPQLRMISQIADGAQAELLGFTATHDQRIRVIESERFGRPDSKFHKRITNLIKR